MAEQHIPCAACKMLEKQCDCDLGRFLPEGEGEHDCNAIHDIYGLENLKRWLEQTNEDQKEALVESLSWEAGIRVQFPITGSYGVFSELCDENLKLKKKVIELEQKLKAANERIACITEKHLEA